MIIYKVYLEGNRTGSMAHILSLPGCFAYGKTEALALRNLRQAVRIHLGWLQKHGMINSVPGRFAFQLAERQAGSPPWSAGSTTALFLSDLIPPTESEIKEYLRLLKCSRSDLLKLVSPLPDRVLDFRLPRRWTIRRNLDHIANAEWWYLSRIRLWRELSIIPQKVSKEKVLQRMIQNRQLAHKILPGLADSRYHQIYTPQKYCNPRLKEPWTARKVLRRFIEHEREHYFNSQRLLKEIKNQKPLKLAK
jgi:predicted RNase H-like HicB family nuclease